MNRMVLGALGALLLVAASTFWWQGRAAEELRAPPEQLALAVPTEDPNDLPTTDADEMLGPDLPEASDLSREQRRFGRFDRDRDGQITRNEMMASRVRDFRKLDADGNNLLTFEEWAVTTANRFKAADGNGDLWLDRAEFASTAPKAPKRPACKCR